MITNPGVGVSKKTSGDYSAKILTAASTCWLMAAAVGQWIFAAYIVLFYSKPAFTGAFESWNQVMPHGYVAGEWKGNLTVGTHLLLAVILMLGGSLQLIPYIRKHFPAAHRILGRVYVSAAILVSTAGLIMVWTRGAVGDQMQHISISIQAIYIICFALISIRYARAGAFENHRKWSLRLFMVVNGVWFFRVWLMSWLLINGGPAGFDPKTFTGPFLTFLAISTYAIPLSLIVLEMYFFARRKQDNLVNICVSIVIFAFTVIMGIGIFGATMAMWLPRM